METVTSNQAKTQFSDLLLKVQRAPVEISHNGKPVAVIMSADDYAAMESLRMAMLRQSLQRGLASLQAGKLYDGNEALDAMINAEGE